MTTRDSTTTEEVPNNLDVDWPYAIWPTTNDVAGLKCVFSEVIRDGRFVVVLTKEQCSAVMREFRRLAQRPGKEQP